MQGVSPSLGRGLGQNGRGQLAGSRTGDGDEDQGAAEPAVMRDRRRRARCVPDRPVNAGYLRSLADSPMYRLTCGRTG
jgi:hypothetical protein